MRYKIIMEIETDKEYSNEALKNIIYNLLFDLPFQSFFYGLKIKIVKVEKESVDQWIG